MHSIATDQYLYRLVLKMAEIKDIEAKLASNEYIPQPVNHEDGLRRKNRSGNYSEIFQIFSTINVQI